MSFQIIPAIDLLGGRVVRLMQGNYERRTTYTVEAHALAAQYVQGGACWLHVVDLDGARGGKFENLETIEVIARQGMRVQVGGGVREERDLQRLFAAGVARVVIGSVAVREPGRAAEWLAKFGAGRIVIALDSRWENGCWTLPVTGWRESSAHTLDELAPWYIKHGARHLLCTDISRDGMLAGGNIELYRHLTATVPRLSVQASGGVSSLDDLCALREAGAAAAILGRALLEGRFTIAEALCAVSTVPC